MDPMFFQFLIISCPLCCSSPRLTFDWSDQSFSVCCNEMFLIFIKKKKIRLDQHLLQGSNGTFVKWQSRRRLIIRLGSTKFLAHLNSWQSIYYWFDYLEQEEVKMLMEKLFLGGESLAAAICCPKWEGNYKWFSW